MFWPALGRIHAAIGLNWQILVTSPKNPDVPNCRVMSPSGTQRPNWVGGKLPLHPQVQISICSERGVRTGCLSNTNEAHWTRATRYDGGPLTNCAAVKHMEILLASHEMGCVKPDEAIYEKAERISGYPGERIVFFDDLDRNIDAAKARGWRAHKIDHEGCPATQMRKVLTGMEIL